MIEEEIQAEIAKTQGWDLERKMYHYMDRLVRPVRKCGYDISAFQSFSDTMFELAAKTYKWQENPPVWYHGGPAGMKAGDALLSYPQVPNAGSTPLEYMNDRLRLALNPSRQVYVFFTHDRDLAITYSQKFRDGRTYRVKPEGDIQVDPNAFCLWLIGLKDKDISVSAPTLACWALAVSPAWRAPSATVLGAG